MEVVSRESMLAIGVPVQAIWKNLWVVMPEAWQQFIRRRETFGGMYEWAQQEALPAGECKLDRGYTVAGDENEHYLFIGLLLEKGWREVNRN